MTTPALIPVGWPDQRGRKNLWIGAAALAVTLHVAFVAFAVARLREEPEDADLGAPGIEVSFELASPQTTPVALPPGPESEASAASSATAEQKSKVKPVDLPKDKPVETDDPDQQAAETPDTRKEEEPDNAAKLVNRSEQSQAQEATAAPSIQNAIEAPKSATRDQGTGESRQRLRVTWQKELLAHLDKFKRYPADRMQKAADIIVRIDLDRMGKVVSAAIAKSSGDQAFDGAALAMVQRASPVPPPPPLVADEGLSFSLPVIFRKNSR
jgi:periplasmic protein TonB